VDELAGSVAMEDLFRRERDSVLRMCRALMGNEHDAEDAIQEAFTRMHSRLRTLNGEPGAYLNVVARRVCWELLRASGRALPLDTAAPTEEADPEEATILRQSLVRSWSRLSHTERDLIAGSFAGYSYDELAVRVGVSAKSVSVRLHRARSHARRVRLEWASPAYSARTPSGRHGDAEPGATPRGDRPRKGQPTNL
jgi:RNA polymerase sigma-70 factor, ECF subfamily